MSMIVSGANTLRFAIYSDNSGAPNNLLVSSSPISYDNGVNFAVVTAKMNIRLAAGYYWLAYINQNYQNNANEFDYGTVNQWAYAPNTFSNGVPSQVTNPNYMNFALAIWANYYPYSAASPTPTPTSTPTPTPTPTPTLHQLQSQLL
jgi:hypothetical protein